MQQDQDGIHDQRCHQSLDHADHGRSFPCLLKLRKPELVSDIESDKPQSNIVQSTYALQILHRVESDSVNTESSQHKRSHQNAGDQERRHIWKIQLQIFKYTGHQKTRKQSQSNFQ